MSSVTAALVGYTNAGKSSLMNRLCRVNILEEDKLFATLDSTYRILNPDTKPNMILIDTVGFISNLPNTLLEGFKTTLESAIEADLIIIVVDISDPHYQKHLEVTKNILNELGITNKEQMIVFNKKDQLQDVFKQKIILRSHPNSFLVSSFDKKDMKDLRSFILNHFLDKQNHYDLFVPYEEGNVHSTIMSKSNIIKSYPHEKGIFYRIKIPQFIFKTLGVEHFILSPTDPMRKEFSF
jgi:GTP-binding protein HflX